MRSRCRRPHRRKRQPEGALALHGFRRPGSAAPAGLAERVGLEQVGPQRLHGGAAATGGEGYSYALIGDYLPFDRPVPFAGGVYAEAALRAIGDPTRVGAYLQGKSIRTISEADFATIARAGLDETLPPENAVRLELDPPNVDPETVDLVRAPPEQQARQIEQILLNRKVRDANFRRQICEAYDNRCAVTGLRMVTQAVRQLAGKKRI